MRTRRAQLRQRAQDETIDVAAGINPITAQGSCPIQLVKAGGERPFIEGMHQAVKPLVPVARR